MGLKKTNLVMCSIPGVLYGVQLSNLHSIFSPSTHIIILTKHNSPNKHAFIKCLAGLLILKKVHPQVTMYHYH